MIDGPEVQQASQPAKKRKARINHALAGTLLATGCTLAAIAPQVGAKNAESLRAALARKGVTTRSVRNLEPRGERRVTVTAKLVEEATEGLRASLNGSLAAVVSAFNSKSPTRKSLASKGQGDAATLKQIAETWRTLNGNPDSISISFGARGLSGDMPPVAPVIDCQVMPATPQAVGPEHDSQVNGV